MPRRRPESQEEGPVPLITHGVRKSLEDTVLWLFSFKEEMGGGWVAREMDLRAVHSVR